MPWTECDELFMFGSRIPGGLVTKRQSPSITTRKQPQQARSNELVRAVLRAAIQVLEKEGAPRFTMARVAERAGVSVGSLYQYFPNKAAILFRLQTDEWRETTDLMRGLLEDRGRPPLDRLHSLVHAFVQSECDEAAVRIALSDAAPLYRDAPEAYDVRASGDRIVAEFMREALPGAPASVRALAGDLVTTTLSAVGKVFSETLKTQDEIRSHAEALAVMLCAYLQTLGKAGSRRQPRRPRHRRAPAP